MERLEAKKINGRTYYYYSEWGWVDGKCRRLWQKYLGKPSDIAKAMDGGPPPDWAEVFQFGLPTALWQESDRQGIVREVDSLCPKRDQGLSVGQYLAVAAVNRAIDPVSKRGMWEWFCATTLRRLLPDADKASLDARRFWDHMDMVDPDAIPKIWRNIVSGTLRRENIDLSQVSYDGTNFYTFISTFNTNCSIAQRGKNKQGRCNLRQVSYALFCTKDSMIPLLYDVYEGNCNDARQFPVMIRRFHQFLKELSANADLPTPKPTLVFDKGNNSAANIELLDQLELHFVGSVKLGEHHELASISNGDERFEPCRRPGLEGIKAFSLHKQVYGRRRRVVVVFNQELFTTQWQTLNNDVAKAVGRLAELKQRLDDRANGLIKGGRPPTEASVKKQCAAILKRPFLAQVISADVQARERSPLMCYRIDTEALARVADTYLGKKLVITTREAWGDDEVIETYHGQYVIEHIFRDMKTTQTGTWWPLHHWTEQKIRVHALYCTIATLLRALLLRRTRHAGLTISMQRLLDELAGIREVINVRKQPRRRQKEQRQAVLSKLNDVQKTLFDALELERGKAV